MDHKIWLCPILAATLIACSNTKIPFVYQVEIPQGNLITQDMVDELEVGMTKAQVQFILGSPTLIDTFHQDRWDYPFSVIPTRGDHIQTQFTVFFDENNTLESYRGEVPPAEFTTPS